MIKVAKFWYKNVNLMGPVEAFITAWRKSFDYEGKATRAEFWWFYLATSIVSLLLFFIFIVAYLNYISVFPLISLYFFGQIFPFISITIRRIRDTGKKWTWIFVGMVPFIGPILYLILLCQPSDTYARKDRFI